MFKWIEDMIYGWIKDIFISFQDWIVDNLVLMIASNQLNILYKYGRGGYVILFNLSLILFNLSQIKFDLSRIEFNLGWILSLL